MPYILPKTEVPKLLDFLLSKKFDVIAPVETEDGIDFESIRDGNKVTLNYVNTLFPPKRFFLPNGEVLFEVRKRKGRFEIIETVEKTKRVIFGIRPCDVNALLVLDKLFIDEVKDPYYIARRKNTLILAVQCERAGENCFCYAFGTDKLNDDYDLLFVPNGEKYFVKVSSKAGEDIVKKSGLFELTNENPPKIKLKFKKKFNLKIVETNLARIFNDTKWEKVAKRCLSCAGCSIVCPTCYCFEIEDIPEFDWGSKRHRYWSSCLLQSFTRVSGDFVFREKRSDRIKQFVYHKLLYYKEKFGVQLCVGCGRCIEVCPTDIDFFKEVERMVGVKK